MTVEYTARYIRVPSGYTGQLVDWPEVVTEGRDMDACRVALKDALQEMLAAYRQLGKEPPEPSGQTYFESISAG